MRLRVNEGRPGRHGPLPRRYSIRSPGLAGEAPGRHLILSGPFTDAAARIRAPAGGRRGCPPGVSLEVAGTLNPYESFPIITSDLAEVDRVMKRDWYIDTVDAGLDDEQVIAYWKFGETPEEFVAWFADDADLYDFRNPSAGKKTWLGS